MDREFILQAHYVTLRLEKLASEYHTAMTSAFLLVERYDMDLARLATDVYSDRDSAALWLGVHDYYLDAAPWELIAAGKVEPVRQLLRRRVRER